MNPSNDLDLINKVKKYNCSDSILELMNRHAALNEHICQKYSHVAEISNSGIHHQDLTANWGVIVYNSCQNYNPDRGVKFSSYLGDQTRFFCLKEIKKVAKVRYQEPDTGSFDYTSGTSIEGYNDNNHNYVLEEAIELVKELKDPKVLKVFKMRFKDSPDSLDTISKELGCSIEWARQLYLKAINHLKKNQSLFEKLRV